MRRDILTAIMFLTRIRVPPDVDHSPDALARCTAYFPLVGGIVGGIGALVYLVAHALFTPTLAAVFAVAATACVTGAFHEDAFADVCDAFGGYTPEKRREIMRDSRVGSFAVVGLTLLLAAKILLVGSFPLWQALCALPFAHALGRWSSVWLIWRTPYVDDPESLAKPFAGQVTRRRLIIATATVAVFGGITFGIPATLIAFGMTLAVCYG
ncbi:MAG: adenosylcobinamide-GDP ribazoletransferase, partial [Akkermansiaceae bacterium]|nr:adenosylcobinamide-GDP ribazoletransferase [Armatimonadota bacterium]